MHEYKVKVFVNHKPIGWLREVGVAKGVSESVVSVSLARASRYKELEAGYAMATFQGPDRESEKRAMPVVTFQLQRI